LDKVVVGSRSENLIKGYYGGTHDKWRFAMKLDYPKSLYVLGQMVLMFFKGQGLVSPKKSMIVIFPIFWGSIAWPIEKT
jgi:hypothetical protein